MKTEGEQKKKSKQQLVQELTEMRRRVDALEKSEVEYKRARRDLLETEKWYRSTFEDSPISLWEKDFSDVKAYVESLRKKGVKNFRTYFENSPEEVARCADMVKIIDVNQRTLQLYAARSKVEFKASLTTVFSEESYDVAKEQLIAIAEGNTRFESEAINRTLAGERINIFLKWSVAPGYEKSLSKVLVCIVDLTERKKAEEALRQSEEKYRLFVQNVPGAAFLGHLDFTPIFFHGAVATITGYTEDEFKECKPRWDEIIHPEDLVEMGTGISKIGSVPYYSTEREYRVLHRDGSVRWVHEFIKNICDHSGKPFMVQGVIYDITKRKQAEEALHESEEHYRELFETSRDGIALTDLEGRCLDCNHAYLDLLGYFTIDELRGRSCEDLTPSEYHEFEAKITKEQTLVFGRCYEYEKEYFRKTAERVPVSIRAWLRRDVNNQPIGMWIIARDISRRKRQQEIIRSEHDLLNRIMEASPAGIVLVNRDKQITFANARAEKVLGLTRAETGALTYCAPEWHITDCDGNPLPDEDLVFNIIMKLGQPVFDKSHAIEWPCGRRVLLSINAAPLFDESGKVDGVIAVVEDVTTRVQMEKALQQAKDYAESLIETANVMVVGLDRNGCIRVFNDTAEKVTGYVKAEIVGKNWFDVIVPKDRYPSVWKMFMKWSAGGSIAKTFENPILTKSGDERLISWQNNELQVSDNTEMISFGIDVTDRKRAKEALRKSEERARVLWDYTRAGILVIDAKTHEIVDVNIIAREMIGLPKPRIVGRVCQKFVCPTEEGECPITDLGRLVNDKECILLKGNNGSVEILKTVTRVEFDGEPYLLESFVDITKRKRSEEALEVSEEKYRTMIENSNDLIWLLDKDGNFTYFNKKAEEVSGYNLKEWLGKSFAPMIPSADLERVQSIFREVMNGKAIQHEVSIYRQDGSIFVLSVNTTPMYSHGEVVGTISFGQDITDRKKAESELKQSLERLRKTQEQTVDALVAAAEITDPYKGGHQRRATQFACAIAKELNLPEEQVAGLRLAGALHDFGKINIPAEILSKPGQLPKTEWAMIITHPQVAYNILKVIDFSWPIAQIVLQHHERMDGSGYPDGLCGERILIEARIMGVADSLEAMASHRPYRPALSIGRALDEISQNKSVLFDSNVVEACIAVLTKKGFGFE